MKKCASIGVGEMVYFSTPPGVNANDAAWFVPAPPDGNGEAWNRYYLEVHYYRGVYTTKKLKEGDTITLQKRDYRGTVTEVYRATQVEPSELFPGLTLFCPVLVDVIRER